MARQRIEPGQESVWDYPRPPRLEGSERRVKESRAAWFYPGPVPAYGDLKDCVAFYPSKMDACRVDGEKVRAQEGEFYGRWITSDTVGPSLNGPGTWGW